MSNLLLKHLLPTELKWITVKHLKAKDKEFLSNSYKTILIAKEKHGDDIQTVVGWIYPINNYTDFEIFSKPWGLTKTKDDYKENLNDIIAIAILDFYKLGF